MILQQTPTHRMNPKVLTKHWSHAVHMLHTNTLMVYSHYAHLHVLVFLWIHAGEHSIGEGPPTCFWAESNASQTRLLGVTSSVKGVVFGTHLLMAQHSQSPNWQDLQICSSKLGDWYNSAVISNLKNRVSPSFALPSSCISNVLSRVSAIVALEKKHPKYFKKPFSIFLFFFWGGGVFLFSRICPDFSSDVFPPRGDVFFPEKNHRPQWTTHWSFHDPILGKCYEVSRPVPTGGWPDPSSLKLLEFWDLGPLINEWGPFFLAFHGVITTLLIGVITYN